MHYTVKFDGTKQQKQTAAMKEVWNYLGKARYLHIRRTLVDDLLKGNPSRTNVYRTVRMVCSFVGISGYWPERAVAGDVLKVLDAVKQPAAQN